MAEWSNTLADNLDGRGKYMCSTRGRKVLEVLKGIKVNSPHRSILQYPWGMHICDYQQKKDITSLPNSKSENRFHYNFTLTFLVNDTNQILKRQYPKDVMQRLFLTQLTQCKTRPIGHFRVHGCLLFRANQSSFCHGN